ncbi:RNA polymerase II holoenzyme cyclin-like subunit [[Candida] jaroonii]|uniref:RNA polymerase II holoenzyme cyclin-like subunit n=1 Tax=[Candida] jaroonii TaxID=467808 RepID=A0ACA9YBE3_9ASCO|nr:RNA polymerase II holoenzyme cyclin-like subunit [[Candida] jaroonii]
MSANFWNSTQREKWQFNRQSLLDQRRRLLILEKKMIQNGFIKDYPNINYDSNMRIYLHNLIIKLGRRLNIRQVALATAEIYVTRFLLKVSLKEINVYLMVTTSIYVACKIEETPQHIRLVISEARNLWPEYIPSDISKLAEFEFYLIEEMDLYLLLHHPYKSLIQIKDFLNENFDEYQLQLTSSELQHSWSLLNDSYITDLHLLYPPHILALSSIYITIVLKKTLNSIRSDTVESNDKDLHIDDLISLTNNNPSNEINTNLDSKSDEDTIKINKFMNFLSRNHVNLDQVVESVQDLINLYVIWNRYNESNVKKALQYMLLNR